MDKIPQLSKHQVLYPYPRKFLVLQPHNSKRVIASWLFSNLQLNCYRLNDRIVYVNNQLYYLSGSKVKNKVGKPELQIVVSFNNPRDALEINKERWQIETTFKGLKTSGFNIEDTHLTDIERIEKLFALVTVAFTWAYVVGNYLHHYVKPIQIKTHGNKAKSIFKYGLTYITIVLLNSNYQPVIDVFKFLSCT